MEMQDVDLLQCVDQTSAWSPEEEHLRDVVTALRQTQGSLANNEGVTQRPESLREKEDVTLDGCIQYRIWHMVVDRRTAVYVGGRGAFLLYVASVCA